MSTTAQGPQPSEAKLHGRRILVCLDRSTFSEGCVPHAVFLAKAFGSAVTIAHVMHSNDERSGPRTHDALSWEIARQEAQGYLDRLGKEASEALGRPVEVRLEQGHPAERIVDLAQEIGADLTVLGSHGEGGITSWTLGTTVQQLLVVVRTSVFIAHSSAAVPRTPVTPKHIVVPLDGSIRSESVLPAAVHIASVNGADISLVHVVQEPLVTALLDAEEDLELAQKLATHLESAAKRYLGRLQERLAHKGTSVHTVVVRHPNERQGLLEISRREQADLIVLSAHGAACDPARSFGGVTTYLLTHSRVPLLVVQDLPEAERHRVLEGEASHPPPCRQARLTSESE
jgi:nucleotide-binding universal stress UspA family protein